MAPNKLKVNSVDNTSSNKECKNILDAYRVQLDFFKLQNDNYFKRVQILMVVIQVALFSAALRFLPLKSGTWYGTFLLMVIAILGIFSARHWSSLNEKQNQYMEFCRRTLRNLEARLVEFGVPLRYFTLEAHVFGPLRTVLTNSAGTSVRMEGSRHITQFEWSKEEYPDPDMVKDGIHCLKKVGGGMIAFEKGIARSIITIWSIVLILLFIKCILQVVCI